MSDLNTDERAALKREGLPATTSRQGLYEHLLRKGQGVKAALAKRLNLPANASADQIIRAAFAKGGGVDPNAPGGVARSGAAPFQQDRGLPGGVEGVTSNHEESGRDASNKDTVEAMRRVLRARFGLAADASDDEIMAALTADDGEKGQGLPKGRGKLWSEGERERGGTTQPASFGRSATGAKTTQGTAFSKRSWEIYSASPELQRSANGFAQAQRQAADEQGLDFAG